VLGRAPQSPTHARTGDSIMTGTTDALANAR